MTDKTLVTFLLDKSGSMGSIKYDTMGAFNAYLDELRKSADSIDFSLLQFDTISLEKTCVNEPVATAPALTDANYKPNGGTPLIDAAYNAIQAVEVAISKRDIKPKIVICIQTDGQENSSVEHTWDELNSLIKEKTALGWQFNFMGAGIDAYEQGRRMGVMAESTVSYDSSNAASTDSAFVSSAMNTRSFATGASSNTNYSLGQKSASGDKFDPSGGWKQPGLNPKPKAKKSIVDKINL